MSIANALPPLTEESNLPEGWAEIRISDYFDSWGGLTPSTSEKSYWDGKVPWVSSKDIKRSRVNGGQESITQKALKETRLRICPVGSVLVVVRSGILAHTLPIAIADAPLTINQDLKAFWSPEPQLNEWLAVALRALAPKILGENRKDGTTVQSVRYTELCDLAIAVPPPSEQKRIVDKVEQLLARVNAARERLARVPAVLKRFRRAVLASACSGDLTADWRGIHTNLVTARALLAEIKPEVLGGSKKFDEAAHCQLAEEPFELPSTWAWASTADLCIAISDGDHQPPPKAEQGIPFVVISNLTRGRLDLHHTMFVRPDYYRALSKERKPQRGDVLYSVTGSFGIPVLINADAEFCFQRHIALLRPHSKIHSGFLYRVMNSKLVFNQASTVATGIAQLTVPLSGLRRFRVPVPPLEEQAEINLRVERLFNLADAIEKRVAVATARAERLTQAILAKAFRGELVPTEAELARREDRSYEPASVLLARILAERAGRVESAQSKKYGSVRASSLTRIRGKSRSNARAK